MHTCTHVWACVRHATYVCGGQRLLIGVIMWVPGNKPEDVRFNSIHLYQLS